MRSAGVAAAGSTNKCGGNAMNASTRFGLLLAAGIMTAGASAGQAADRGDWIGTWGASAQPVWAPDFLPSPKVPPNFFNQTVRELATISIGGSRVRVVLTNEYGTRPLTIGAAHIAIFDKGAAI